MKFTASTFLAESGMVEKIQRVIKLRQAEAELHRWCTQ